MVEKITPGFDAVDQSGDPAKFVNYLKEINSLSTIRAYKSIAHTLLEVRDGDSILDVGCGAGIDTKEIALLFGPNIRITGIDKSEIMIGIAKLSLNNVRNSTPITYAVQDARALSFGDNEFDITRADRTFQHLKDPKKALGEMIRVTKQGGKILLADTDWSSLDIKGISQENLETIRKTYNAIISNPGIATQFEKLMKEEGIKKDKIISKKTQLIFTGLSNIKDALLLDIGLDKAEKMGVITQEEKLNLVSALEKSDPDSIHATADLYLVRGIKV